MKSLRLLAYCAVVAALVFASCKKLPTAPAGTDLSEMERVYQCCKAYSIYSNRLPANTETQLSSYDGPQNLVDVLGDTLRNWWGDKLTLGTYFPTAEDMAGLFGNASGRDALASSSIPNPVYKMVDSSTVYIWVNTFLDENLPSAFAGVANAAKKCTRVIVDLRYNGGGYVEASRDLVGYFVKPSVPYLICRHRNENATNAADTGWLQDTWTDEGADSTFEKSRLVVLTDSMSASASEIFAASVRTAMPAKKCVIIGQTSFGKAIGQSELNFTRGKGAGLYLTIEKFFTAYNGKDSSTYHLKGITPDYTVSWPVIATESGNTIYYDTAARYSSGIAAAVTWFNGGIPKSSRAAPNGKSPVSSNIPAAYKNWGLALEPAKTIRF